jgi:protein SCO1/2
MPRIGRRRCALIALLVAAALAGCDKLGPPGLSQAGFTGVDITGAEYGRELALPDAEGRARTLADFKGKVTVVFFGYTQCPDVCPTTMAELARIRRSMGTDGERVQGIFVTVDPERDTPEVLRAYLASFDPSFVALRGSPEQTAAAAREFKVFYARVPGRTAGSYTVDHTAGSYVIDAKGRLRLFERYGTPADALAADLKQILKEG